jgi:hypothetical protein
MRRDTVRRSRLKDADEPAGDLALNLVISLGLLFLNSYMRREGRCVAPDPWLGGQTPIKAEWRLLGPPSNTP